MACICGHTAGSPATQRIHERNCAAAGLANGETVKKVVKKAAVAVKKVVKKVTKRK